MTIPGDGHVPKDPKIREEFLKALNDWRMSVSSQGKIVFTEDAALWAAKWAIEWCAEEILKTFGPNVRERMQYHAKIKEFAKELTHERPKE